MTSVGYVRVKRTVRARWQSRETAATREEKSAIPRISSLVLAVATISEASSRASTASLSAHFGDQHRFHNRPLQASGRQWAFRAHKQGTGRPRRLKHMTGFGLLRYVIFSSFDQSSPLLQRGSKQKLSTPPPRVWCGLDVTSISR